MSNIINKTWDFFKFFILFEEETKYDLYVYGTSYNIIIQIHRHVVFLVGVVKKP